MTDATRKFSTMPPPSRQRPVMVQLALASGVLIQSHLLNKKPTTQGDFWHDDTEQSIRASMESVVKGIKEYQSHPYRRPLQRYSVVWADGEARIVWFSAKGRTKKPKASIFIIPSLINNTDILDILPDKRSLVRWLTAQGFDVFLLQWGDLCNDTELHTMDNIVGRKLSRAVAWLKDSVDIPLFGVGYCMGGLFLAAQECLNPHIFDGLIFIATPWDFHAGAKGNFADVITHWSKDGLSQLQTNPSISHDFVYQLFAGVDPAMIARKFTAFSMQKKNTREAQLFVGVEDWLNSGGNIPSTILYEIVTSWYQNNDVSRGLWSIQGHRINARHIKKPSLVIIPTKDKIVPPASARSLAQQIKAADRVTPDCGHISMMVAPRAEAEVWEKMAAWIKKTSRKR